MIVKFINYQKDYLRFKKEYDKVWKDINMRGDLILRKDTREFEERLAKYVGTKFAVALSSGTDAIYLSLKALNLPPYYIKGRIAVPCLTFKSTCGAVINAGSEPILYDMDGLINEECRVAIIAHIAGEIFKINRNPEIIIEDACQAFGALKNPISKVQCWSFYPAKILGCKGDAGAITTNDEKVYEYVKEARNHFKTDNRDFGGNYRMDNLQAGLLNIKIQHIDEILARRKEIAEMYLKELPEFLLPNNQEGRVWQDFVIRTENFNQRNELYKFLKKRGIETIENDYPFTPQYPKLPLCAIYESETLRIPCNENLEDSEVDYVIKCIREFYVPKRQGNNNL